MKRILLAPLPVMINALLVLLAGLPWGGPDWLEFALGLAPVAAIYFWSQRRPRLMPPLAVFCLGLVLDIMTHGPLGIWTTAALLAALIGRRVRRSWLHVGWARGGLLAAAALALATGLVGGLMSIYSLRLVPPPLLLQAFFAALALYPLLAGLMMAVDRAWAAPEGRSLFMRGD